MICILDADIICYRAAAASENEEEAIAVFRFDDLFRRILHETESTQYEAYLSGQDNFRKTISTEYKANRTQQKPKWLETLREHCVMQWKASVASEIEADDEIGMAATSYFTQDVPFIIASIDKDLKQLPGKHYNFVKQQYDFVSPIDALRSFYKQMLVGDRSDNITGVQGIGEVKAGRILNPLHTEEDMFDAVWNMYSNKQHFFINSQLLWILKQKNDPTEVLHHYLSLQKPEVEATLLSLPTFKVMSVPGLDATHQQKTTQDNENGCQ